MKHILFLMALLICTACKDGSTSAVHSVGGQGNNVAKDVAVQQATPPQANVENCIEKSSFSLPYDQTMNPKMASYERLACNISGVEQFLCEHKSLRYIALPKFEHVDVILVPMDCGDFEYRYVLLTVFEKKVASSHCVEGEWSDSEDGSMKEVSSFRINEDYQIVVKTDVQMNGVKTSKPSITLHLREDGTFNKS